MNEVVDKILDYNSDKAIAEKLRAEKNWQRHYNTSMDVAREEGIKEGIKEGEKNAKLETAKKMKSDGLANEMISKYTGISISEIEKL